ncbi:unnamed protein product [Acanthoscelides obtectus]|uniref:Uncharacterized protein n=1 Tax=Acanthoscelides obtectus TaxID=200917 RepID=A0A9P0PL35_ACAOB|nr:unnamed protein product [Acanthoscelides obtectus]CAK1672458.1 hypothetical protein AOBTE_LOCUS28910 [Acanthoscelides obtectus]
MTNHLAHKNTSQHIGIFTVTRSKQSIFIGEYHLDYIISKEHVISTFRPSRSKCKEHVFQLLTIHHSPLQRARHFNDQVLMTLS